MRLAFFASDKPREQALASAFLAGAKRYGVEVETRSLDDERGIDGLDLAAMVGVKSRDLFRRCWNAGVIPIMLDKGYSRHRLDGERVWEFWRVSFGAHHPTFTTLTRRAMPFYRFDALGLEILPWRRPTSDGAIVIAGSTAKYHAFYDLPDPTDYASQVAFFARQFSTRPIIYRPKPSWRGAAPIEGAGFSAGKESLADCLANAEVLITHGSNACFEAALLGVPSIILGPGVMAPISSTGFGDLAKAKRLKRGNREQLLANLAWHQWTENEMRDGALWETAKGWINDLQSV